MRFKKIRLGDLLVQHDFISQTQLENAIAQQKKTGGKLGKVLVSLGLITEDELLTTLSEQLEIPFINLMDYDFNVELVKRLPETLARRFRAIILDEKNKNLLVGLADPLDIHAYDELSRILKQPLSLGIVREEELLNSIDLMYRHQEQITGFAEALSHQVKRAEIDLAHIGDNLSNEEAPVVKLVQTLFDDAVKMQASDIHIEPEESILRIRQRIDGSLQETIMKEHQIAPALTQRIKLMAGLNIAEKRLPQDGRFTINVSDHIVDVRVSTMPTKNGEAVVLRILDQSKAMLNLGHLGLQAEQLKQVRELIHIPHGIILVTGPTGSGKTTTLYSILNELNQSDKKIITVEDPVEYQLPRINQVQVNPTIDLSFARVLRTALRHDPDILLVGEIRDTETARIALRAAMTGHLVLATLHTNDAVSSAMRLLDMDVEGYLVATSLRAVIAQRLLRKICLNCKQEYQPDDQELAWLEAAAIPSLLSKTYYKGSGCTYCNKSGYSGRVGVYEIMIPNPDMLQALRRYDPAAFVRAAQQREGNRPLAANAMDMAIRGETTLEEVIRISGELSDKVDYE